MELREEHHHSDNDRVENTDANGCSLSHPRGECVPLEPIFAHQLLIREFNVCHRYSYNFKLLIAIAPEFSQLAIGGILGVEIGRHQGDGVCAALGYVVLRSGLVLVVGRHDDASERYHEQGHCNDAHYTSSDPSFNIADVLILPYDNIWLWGVFDIEPSILKPEVTELLFLESFLIPSHLYSFLKLLLSGHALKLRECHHCPGPSHPHIPLQLLVNFRAYHVDLVNLWFQLSFFFLVNFNHLLVLFLLVEQISHPYHEVHLAVVAQRES